MSLARSSPGLYPHILKMGEVAIYKSSGIGSKSILVRKTFTGLDSLIDIEFENGHILQVASGLLFWEEHCIENPGTEQSETGSSEVVARIHKLHQLNYVVPVVVSEFAAGVN